MMRNDRLDEVQAGIKIAGRNINNLRHADDTTFMEEMQKGKMAVWGGLTHSSEKQKLEAKEKRKDIIWMQSSQE